jgi:phosphoribosylformylglycinamidine synthase
VILLVGATAGWLGQSMYLAALCGREEGAPPPVDLAAERRNGDFVRGLIARGAVSAVHDLSDGGLAIAVAEMALAGGIGATLDAAPGLPAHAFLFGEDQGRYVITATAADAAAIEIAAKAANVAICKIGVTGGDALALAGESPLPLTELLRAHEHWLPDYMASASI